MNGIETIIRRLYEDTQAEIDEILGAAAVEAGRIKEQYASLAAHEAETLRRRNEKAAAEREECLGSAAQAEARKTILSSKQELVDGAYTYALEKLRTLPEKPYTELLTVLLERAAPDGRGEVMFAPKDQTIGRAAVAMANQRNGGTLIVSEEICPIEDGLILRNGRVEANCTFEMLLRLQRQESAGMVAEQLFG